LYYCKKILVDPKSYFGGYTWDWVQAEPELTRFLDWPSKLGHLTQGYIHQGQPAGRLTQIS
jgi:hypothetical protein